MKRFTETQFRVLKDLYHEMPDTFRALPLDIQEAWWAALYLPSLRVKN